MSTTMIIQYAALLSVGYTFAYVSPYADFIFRTDSLSVCLNASIRYPLFLSVLFFSLTPQPLFLTLFVSSSLPASFLHIFISVS